MTTPNKLSASLYFIISLSGFLYFCFRVVIIAFIFFFARLWIEKTPYMPFFMSQSKQTHCICSSRMQSVIISIHSLCKNRLRRHLETRRAQTVAAPLGNLDQQFAFLVSCDRRSKFIKRSFRNVIVKPGPRIINEHAQRLNRNGSAIANVEGEVSRAASKTSIPSFSFP